MKTVKMDLNGQTRVITDNQFRLYREMNIAKREFTKDEIERFINATDPDITTEIWEEQIFPELEESDFSEFYPKYQAKHRAKYGTELNTID